MNQSLQFAAKINYQRMKNEPYQLSNSIWYDNTKIAKHHSLKFCFLFESHNESVTYQHLHFIPISAFPRPVPSPLPVPPAAVHVRLPFPRVISRPIRLHMLHHRRAILELYRSRWKIATQMLMLRLEKCMNMHEATSERHKRRTVQPAKTTGPKAARRGGPASLTNPTRVRARHISPPPTECGS